MSDRTVHAWSENGQELVRYDRAGKWYLEKDGEPRRLLTLMHAVAYATRMPDWHINFGEPGGKRFDAACRKAASGVSR